MLAEDPEHMFRDGALLFPFERMLQEILPEELAAGFLEPAMAISVIGGWEAAEVRGFREGDWIEGDGGHGALGLRFVFLDQ